MTDEGVEAYVSTGALPSPEAVRTFVREAYERYRSDTAGDVCTQRSRGSLPTCSA